MIQAIFFDFNGVIIDDEMLQMKAYQEAFTPYAVPLSEQQYLQALGMDDQMFVQTAFANAGVELTNEMKSAIAAVKQEVHRRLLTDDLPLFNGVKTFLKACSRHFSLGLVSMANKTEVGYVFARANLTPLFSVIVTSEDASVCKPAPDCYLAGLTKLNERRQQERELPLLASECLAIEDSPPGIQSARAAGMHTLGVTNTVSAEALREAGAEVVTASLADWTVAAVELLF